VSCIFSLHRRTHHSHLARNNVGMLALLALFLDTFPHQFPDDLRGRTMQRTGGAACPGACRILREKNEIFGLGCRA
jgi:hypothetical protein